MSQEKDIVIAEMQESIKTSIRQLLTDRLIQSIDYNWNETNDEGLAGFTINFAPIGSTIDTSSQDDNGTS